MKEQEYEQINHPNGVTTWKTKPKHKEQAMNREDIIRMAREAGFTDHNGFCEVIVRHSNGSWIGVKDELERFAALVAAAEREACASVCEEQEELRGHTPFDCAAAIRTRSKQ